MLSSMVNETSDLECARRYRESHREELRFAAKVYYYKNKEKKLAYGRKYREKNKDRCLEWQRLWREQHPEYVAPNKRKKSTYEARDKARKYLKTKTDKYLLRARLKKHKRDAIKRGVNDGTVTADSWYEIQKKHGFKCHYCQTDKKTLTLDHVIPLARGGKHTISNIVPCCPSCNSSKNDKLLEEWKKINK